MTLSDRPAVFSISAAEHKPFDGVNHRAALPSLSRSIQDPLRSKALEIDGEVNSVLKGRNATVQVQPD